MCYCFIKAYGLPLLIMDSCTLLLNTPFPLWSTVTGNECYPPRQKQEGMSIKQNPSLLPRQPQVCREPSRVLRIENIAVDVLKRCSLSLRLLSPCSEGLESCWSLCSGSGQAAHLIGATCGLLGTIVGSVSPVPTAASSVPVRGGFLQPRC